MISHVRGCAVALAAALSLVAGLVFVAASPVAASSPGEVWTAHAAAEANTWNSVTYGNGLFVAVSGSGTNRVMTSGSTGSAPAAPTSLVATPGDSSVSIAFTAGDDGGAAISKYQYSTDGGSTWSDADAGTISPVTVSGLTNYTTYSIKLRAVNSAGDGAASSSVSVTPVVAGPTSCSATALSDRSIQACWNPFTPSQGALIKVRARVFFAGTNTILRACVAQVSATSCVAGGLKANTTYDVRVLGRIRIAPHQVFWTSYSTTQQVTTLP